MQRPEDLHPINPETLEETASKREERPLSRSLREELYSILEQTFYSTSAIGITLYAVSTKLMSGYPEEQVLFFRNVSLVCISTATILIVAKLASLPFQHKS